MEGKVFGKYTVLNRIDIGKPRKWYECLCECGVIKIKSASELNAGRATQCQECAYKVIHNPYKKLGMKFNKWTITGYIGMYRKSHQFELTCECGNKGKNIIAELKKGKSTQCRECGNNQAVKKNTTHGMHATRIHKIWSSMKHRCNNKNSTAYNDYGGRGIKVCKRWFVFENFFEDMGYRPKGMTLDRTDNDGNYEPSNCKWVTHKKNCNNTRKNVIITCNDESKSKSQWAEYFGVTYPALHSYLKRHSFEEAFIYYTKKQIDSK